ncbi:MAG: MBL fold metallo-hydrolase [Betaproteobacteria bacterium]|nr:MBL fold metallo-hydrolase [Betaproteobacteria bacterium]
MIRAATLVVLVLASLSPAWAKPAGDPLARAAQALGGAKALSGIKTFAARGTATHWEPEQSLVAGGEPRLAGESSFALSRDFAPGSARTEWVKKLVYPAPREYKFTEIIAGDRGYVAGIDTTARTRQSLDSNPPQHAMSGMRMAAALRELARTSPRLVADMLAQPSLVKRLPDQKVDGAMLAAVSYRQAQDTVTVMFDPKTGLPARIRTHDYDNMHGDSDYDLLLSDWREAGGVKIAHGLDYKLNGIDIGRIRYAEVSVNGAVAAGQFEIPASILATAPRAATGYVPWQWVLRRQNIGVYLDSDAVGHPDGGGLKLVELAPGVSQVVGGTHNSLVVEMDQYLVVFDAPIGETQSRFTLDAAKTKYPGKPVRYLVLTHHHMDHAGGTKTFVAEGAAVIVGAGVGDHIWKTLRTTRRLDGEGGAARLPGAEVIEVADRKILSDGKREVAIYAIENPHARGMLIGYVPGARLGFVTDIWNPGRDRVGDKLNAGQAALVAAIRKYGLDPERFAGGHGSVGNYAELAAPAGK